MKRMKIVMDKFYYYKIDEKIWKELINEADENSDG